MTKHTIDGTEWSAEIGDTYVFVQYRGIDIVAVWLPYTPYLKSSDTGEASVTIPNPARLTDAEDPDYITTEWGCADEQVFKLGSHVRIIDRALLRRQVRLDNPVEDWRYEVANGDTILGFDDWQARKIDEAVSDSFEAAK